MTKTHDMTVIHSSLDPNWRTPQPCFDGLDREFNFGLDLAADAESCLVHRHAILGSTARFFGPGSTLATNALSVSWPDDKPNFLNPPFSRTLAAAYRTGRIPAKGTRGQYLPHPVDLALAEVYEIENWARKCWEESQKGATIVGLFPFAPQTEWYRQYVYGHAIPESGAPFGRAYQWNGHAAKEERRLPHRISFLRSDGSEAANAGVNTAVIVWGPMAGAVGPWQPHSWYWSYR